MIATGTDIKPLEIVLFLRSVNSRSYFEQMKGRRVRVINDNDLKSVTPDARSKTHFIIVDALGVCEHDKTDSVPMERKRTVSLEQLLQAVALGNIEDDVLSSIAGRLARLDKAIGLVTSFEQFIKDHKDEITALQILYSKPYKSRLRFEQIRELASIIEKPPYLWGVDRLWNAYAAL